MRSLHLMAIAFLFVCSGSFASVVDKLISSEGPADSVALLIKNNCKSSLPVSVVKKIITHESKSFYKGRPQPWPWTLNINGVGHYYTSRAQALVAARKVIDDGAKKFGIGLGQIEWSFHKQRFNGNLAMSLHPAKNIAVVCDILAEGMKDKRVDSLRSLVAYYHRPVLDRIAYQYADKVLTL